MHVKSCIQAVSSRGKAAADVGQYDRRLPRIFYDNNETVRDHQSKYVKHKHLEGHI
jgi:hypothetical protein